MWRGEELRRLSLLNKWKMKMEWFVYALVAMVSFTLMFLSFVKIGKLGMKAEVLFMYYCLIAAGLVLVYVLASGISVSMNKYILLFLIVAGITGAVGNIFLFKSMQLAANPGYALAVTGVHVFLVALVSLFVFRSEITLTKGIGMLLAVVGVILLGIE